jgi:hypothetical protein
MLPTSSAVLLPTHDQVYLLSRFSKSLATRVSLGCSNFGIAGQIGVSEMDGFLSN